MRLRHKKNQNNKKNEKANKPNNRKASEVIKSLGVGGKWDGNFRFSLKGLHPLWYNTQLGLIGWSMHQSYCNRKTRD